MKWPSWSVPSGGRASHAARLAGGAYIQEPM